MPEILPSSWGELALWVAMWLLLELRHYLPLAYRYIEARVKQEETRAETPPEEAKNDDDDNR